VQNKREMSLYRRERVSKKEISLKRRGNAKQKGK
jgi:hypothetical protein